MRSWRNGGGGAPTRMPKLTCTPAWAGAGRPKLDVKTTKRIARTKVRFVLIGLTSCPLVPGKRGFPAGDAEDQCNSFAGGGRVTGLPAKSFALLRSGQR